MSELDIQFLNGVELHGDEKKNKARALIVVAKASFKLRTEEIFQNQKLKEQAIDIIKLVDKDQYYLSSSYKRDATIRLRDVMPSLKASEIQEIVQTSGDDLVTQLRSLAGISVRENLKHALDAFVKEMTEEFNKAWWSMIGEFFLSLAKLGATVLSIGYYNHWDDLEESLAEQMALQVEERDVAGSACTKFANILDQHEQDIVQYIKEGTHRKDERETAETHINLVILEEADMKAKSFAPWSAVVWCDPAGFHPGHENYEYSQTLRGTYKERFHQCTQPDQVVEVLDVNPMSVFTVLTAGTNGEALARKIYKKLNVERLTVFCMDKVGHWKWAQAFEQSLGATVHTNIGAVLSKLAEDVELPLAAFLTRDEISERISDSFRISQHSQVQDSAQDLDTLECCRSLLQAREGASGLVDDTEAKKMCDILRDFTDSTKCMRMWTGNGFCYTLTDQLRRCRRDIRLLKMCRLAEHVVMHHTKLSKTTAHGFSGRAFRGLQINDRKLFDIYVASKGKIIFFREFMATSLDPNVARGFGSGSNFSVLLEIDATDVEASMPRPLKIQQWSKYEHEKEVLFPLFSGFEVEDVAAGPNGTSVTLKLKYVFAAPDPSAAFLYAFL